MVQDNFKCVLVALQGFEEEAKSLLPNSFVVTLKRACRDAVIEIPFTNKIIHSVIH